MSCRTEAGVEPNTARAISTSVSRAATATWRLNRVLGVYGYSGFRGESKITREAGHNGVRGDQERKVVSETDLLRCVLPSSFEKLLHLQFGAFQIMSGRDFRDQVSSNGAGLPECADLAGHRRGGRVVRNTQLVLSAVSV